MNEQQKQEQKKLIELSLACSNLRDALVTLGEALRDHRFDNTTSEKRVDISALLAGLNRNPPSAD